MINLEEHKVYVDSLKMDMVPYSIAISALQEAYKDATIKKLNDTIDQAFQTLEGTVSSLNSTIDAIKDIDLEEDFKLEDND
jgi:hypothetical protein